jgi:glycosyltransferase involved in cell wall biosynthesis
MKIAFLNIYQGIVSRGAENFVREVSSRLEKKHQVKVFSAKGRISEVKARSQTPFDLVGKILYKFSLDSHSQRVLAFTLSILPQIWKKDFDWVIPVDGGWQVLILKLFQRFKKYMILVSGQAGIGRDDLRNLRLKPDVFVALTSRAEKWGKETAPRVKILYIPNGVDLRKFKPEIKPIKLNLEKPVIICVAGLNPYKRVDLTIKAVSKLDKGSLLVLGDGPEKEKIDKLGKILLGPKRFLRTTIDYQEMPAYYAAADLFTLVSESSEAFGSAYLEAMASGLPVVATDDESRREIIGEAGLFVNPENLEEYAQALKETLKTDFGSKPCLQAQKFSWDKIASQYEEIMVK